MAQAHPHTFTAQAEVAPPPTFAQIAAQERTARARAALDALTPAELLNVLDEVFAGNVGPEFSDRLCDAFYPVCSAWMEAQDHCFGLVEEG